jgi:hypothetical protein
VEDSRFNAMAVHALLASIIIQIRILNSVITACEKLLFEVLLS